MDPIYLDYNATTPIHPLVAADMQPYFKTHFGNPSSSHVFGLQTKAAVATARQQAADALGAKADEIVFTSGGTESNNLAILGYALAHRQRGEHIITSAVEHPAVEQVCGHLECLGFTVTRVKVDSTGQVDPQDVERAIRPGTILVSIMHANNEVGTIQPIARIGELAHKHGVVLHTDAAQSVGKVSVDVDELQVDLLSVAGHKLYAPKGIGALYIRDGKKLQKQIFGAGQESNLRAGTENVMHIVALGRALQLATELLTQRAAHQKELRDRLLLGLENHLGKLHVHGHPLERLPNTLSVSFENVEANQLIGFMDDVAVSAGAACHSGTVEMSKTLAAMGVSSQLARGTLRFSTGEFLDADQIDRAVQSIVAAVNRCVQA